MTPGGDMSLLENTLFSQFQKLITTTGQITERCSNCISECGVRAWGRTRTGTGFPPRDFLTPTAFAAACIDHMHLWSGLYLCHPGRRSGAHGLGRGRQVSTLSLVGHMRRLKCSAHSIVPAQTTITASSVVEPRCESTYQSKRRTKA